MCPRSGLLSGPWEPTRVASSLKAHLAVPRGDGACAPRPGSASWDPARRGAPAASLPLSGIRGLVEHVLFLNLRLIWLQHLFFIDN